MAKSALATPKGLLERSDDRPAARTVQDGEGYEPKYSSEIAGQRRLKLRGDIARIVFEDTASPRAQNDGIITLCRRNRQDLVDPAPQGQAEFVAARRVSLQDGTRIGSRCSQKRARKRSFQELPIIVAKNHYGGGLNHVIRVESVAMAPVVWVH